MINTHWAISAAHCFSEGPRKLHNKQIRIHGKYYTVEKVVPHPCGLIASKKIDRGAAGGENKDIALFKFKSSEPGPGEANEAAPFCPLYPGAHGSEVGKTLTIIGTGVNGRSGDRDEHLGCDYKLRIAKNRVVSTGLSMPRMDFEEPSTGLCLPMEGIASDGDSGGPGFINED